MRFAREHGLSLFFGALLLACLVGQSFAGLHQFNANAVEHNAETYSWFRYVTSSEFGGDVLENWQSEFLQFFLYILATVWLLERGSSESKPEDRRWPHEPSEPVGRRLRQGEVTALGATRGPEAASLRELARARDAPLLHRELARAVGDRLARLQSRATRPSSATISWGEYWVNADFWDRSLQNWQSEFLAIGTMAVFAVYLRQRGSPESKPVGAPHDATGESN
jgi:hypothetical protein